MDESGVMAEFGSTITFSENAKTHWENINQNSTNHIMLVYSQYYRDYKSPPTMGKLGDKDPARSLTGGHLMERDDLTGQTVFHLETKKLPMKWMQVSPLPTIKKICKNGMHMPSMTSLLLNFS